MSKISKFFICCYLFNVTCHANITWLPANNDLSTPSNSAYNSQIAINPVTNRAISVWNNYNGISYIIQAAYSTNNGKDWIASNNNISTTALSSAAPKMVIDSSNNKVICVWEDLDPSIIKSSYSINGGQDWSSPSTITALHPSEVPQIALANGAAICVWQYFASHYIIRGSYTTDGAQSWNGPIDITPDGTTAAESPQIAMTNSTAICVLRRRAGANFSIQSSYSTDGGANWSVAADIYTITPPDDAEQPQIAMDNTTDTAICIWRREIAAEWIAQTSYSTDGAHSWSTPVSLSTAGGNVQTPQIAIYSTNGTVIAVWSRNDGTNDIVQAAYSSDLGQTWSSPINLSSAGENSINPQIAIYSNNTAFCIWNNSIYGIQSAYSEDNGQTWTRTNNLSPNSSSVNLPDIAANNSTGNFISTWQEEYDGTGNFVVKAAYTFRSISANYRKHRKKLLFQIDQVIELFWEAVPGASSYRIYTDALLTKKIYDGSDLQFFDHGKSKNRSYTYYLTYVDSFGIQSSSTTVTVPRS